MAHPKKESVWDYPRPPRLERFPGPIRIVHRGVTIAEDAWAWRVLETSHPPTYYLPPDQLTEQGGLGLIRSRHRATHCEWKGKAEYLDLDLPGEAVLPACGWRYSNPVPAFADLKDCVALYSGPLELCEVAGEQVQRQEGDFYGGWINSWIDGGKRGFKGGPGTLGW